MDLLEKEAVALCKDGNVAGFQQWSGKSSDFAINKAGSFVLKRFIVSQ